jgi:hypothetical protein
VTTQNPFFRSNCHSNRIRPAQVFYQLAIAAFLGARFIGAHSLRSILSSLRFDIRNLEFCLFGFRWILNKFADLQFRVPRLPVATFVGWQSGSVLRDKNNRPFKISWS